MRMGTSEKNKPYAAMRAWRKPSELFHRPDTHRDDDLKANETPPRFKARAGGRQGMLLLMNLKGEIVYFQARDIVRDVVVVLNDAVVQLIE